MNDDLSLKANPTEYMLALADALDAGEEIILGPTDKELCSQALRASVAHSKLATLIAT
jgi:hypothetical protein